MTSAMPAVVLVFFLPILSSTCASVIGCVSLKSCPLNDLHISRCIIQLRIVWILQCSWIQCSIQYPDSFSSPISRSLTVMFLAIVFKKHLSLSTCNCASGTFSAPSYGMDCHKTVWIRWFQSLDNKISNQKFLSTQACWVAAATWNGPRRVSALIVVIWNHNKLLWKSKEELYFSRGVFAKSEQIFGSSNNQNLLTVKHTYPL